MCNNILLCLIIIKCGAVKISNNPLYYSVVTGRGADDEVIADDEYDV